MPYMCKSNSDVYNVTALKPHTRKRVYIAFDDGGRWKSGQRVLQYYEIGDRMICGA